MESMPDYFHEHIYLYKMIDFGLMFQRVHVLQQLNIRAALRETCDISIQCTTPMVAKTHDSLAQLQIPQPSRWIFIG